MKAPEGLLQGLTVVDFSHRLPGPLAGHLLANLGAKVIKIEDQKFQDAFLSGLFAEFDDSFPLWYQSLNHNKEILRFDFNNPDDLKKIARLTASADGLILGIPPAVQQKLGLTQELLTKQRRALAVVELGSSLKHRQAMHDLNALALTGLLSLYVQGKNDKILDPPFLPVAGIAFGHKLASNLLAALLQARSKNTAVFTTAYLYESTEELFAPFWPKDMRDQNRMKFLHNGLYPCYSIYRLKDGRYAALAAVEDKFWMQFCKLLHLEIEASKRFHHRDNSIFEALSKAFLQYTSEELRSLLSGQDICLSLI